MRTLANHSAIIMYLAVVAAIASGCSNASVPPTNVFGIKQTGLARLANDQSVQVSHQPAADGSWMLAGAAAHDLLYVSDEATVAVYSYPEGKLEGKLRGFFISQGLCVDTKGDVYIADQGYGRVYEYEHGGVKRIKNLYSGDAVGCSVDPTTGNLAVTNIQGNGPKGYGNVAIFTNASGKPKYYKAPGFQEYFFCAYDDKGDLFVDGVDGPGTGYFSFAELPKGSTKFEDITLNQYIGWPGGVQWDGEYVAVGDQSAPSIYRFTISGSKGSLVGTTSLDGATNVLQTWIQDQNIIVPSRPSGKTGYTLIYRYPAGGRAIKRVTKGVFSPQGATVSLAPSP